MGYFSRPEQMVYNCSYYIERVKIWFLGKYIMSQNKKYGKIKLDSGLPFIRIITE